jgi:hypothetical protein
MPSQVDILESLEHRLEQLEKEVGEVKQTLGTVKEQFYLPVATPEGTIRYVRSPRPVSPATAETFRRVAELGIELRKLPEEARNRVFQQNSDAIRAEAIEKGFALEREEDAAIGD